MDSTRHTQQHEPPRTAYVPVYRFREPSAPRPGAEPGGDWPTLSGGCPPPPDRRAALRGPAAVPAEPDRHRVPVRRVPRADLPALHGAGIRLQAHRVVTAVPWGGGG